MRITYMYYLLNETYQPIVQLKRDSNTTKDVLNRNVTYGEVQGWDLAEQALKKLQNIPLFKDIIVSIFQCVDEWDKNKDVIQIRYDRFQILDRNIEKLLTEMNAIISFLETYGFNREQKGFDIKIPPTTDFDEFADYVDSIRKIFKHCPYLHSEEEDIKLLATDVGSIWLKFAVVATSTTLLLKNLAVIVDHCVKIKSHIEVCRQQKELVRTMNLKNNLLENMIKNHKQIIDSLVDTAVKDIQNELNTEDKPLEPEDAQKLKMSVEQLVSLMDKGLEIYSSIDAPKEIQDVFPTSNDVKTLPEVMKLLTEGEDKE